MNMKLREEHIRSRRVTRALQNAKRELDTALRYMKPSETFKDSSIDDYTRRAVYLIDDAIDESLDIGLDLASKRLGEALRERG